MPYKTKYGTGSLQQETDLELDRFQRREASPTPKPSLFLMATAIVAVAFTIMCVGPEVIIKSSSYNSVPMLSASLETTNQQQRSLLLLRHAKSSWDENASQLADVERPLAREGIDAATRLGLYLKKMDVAYPEIIIASPSVRTRATLELVQLQWASAVPVQYNEQLYDLSSTGYLSFVRQLDSKFTRILLVGHNPAMHELVQDLVGDRHVKKLPPGSFYETKWSNLAEWSKVKKRKAETVLFAPPKATISS